MANEQDVTRLIDMLYEKVEDAKAPALKPNMSMVDRDEILDLLDELRAQLPVELRRAKELLAAREKFVEDAKRDVDRMMRQAELEAKSKVSESEILSAAREKSRGMIAHAEERCRRMYQVTNEYTEDALARAEEAMQMALDEVKQSRVNFRSASAAARRSRSSVSPRRKPSPAQSASSAARRTVWSSPWSPRSRSSAGMASGRGARSRSRSPAGSWPR